MRWKRWRVGVSAVVAAAAVAAPAEGSPGSPSSATVTLGDSFISGEAGRWVGNSNSQLGSRNGTDRAWIRTWYGGYYDADRVYVGGSDNNGCHRSDVAEVLSATIAVHEEINLACSGARTSNVFRAATGGQGRNGEPPQADQLATVARQRDVRTVVLSIGGNDLGFGDIIAACAVAWTTSSSSNPTFCQPQQQPLVAQRLPAAMSDVGRAIDEIREVMRQTGYATTQYRLILQSYPSPVPRGGENRYSESGVSRLSTGGCPFWNRDSDWARDSLVDQIADNLRVVAAAKDVTFLDLRDLLQGREVCARSATLVTSSTPPTETRSEWARFLTSGIAQGETQESFHPNTYAQRGLGRCLTLVAATPTRPTPDSPASGFSCAAPLGQGVSGVRIAGLPPTATAARTGAPGAAKRARRRALSDFRALQRRARGAERHEGEWPPEYPDRSEGKDLAGR